MTQHTRPTAAAVSQLWADKYKPQTIAEMCYPVAANRLRVWLEAFVPADNSNNSNSSKTDAKRTRGALLSGPPGVGKTTTVYVVARELGYSVVEYNASDFRSRKSLREHVSDMTTNTAFAQHTRPRNNSNNSSSNSSSSSNSTALTFAKTLLLMDEVDGCDVGGVGEVIEMLRHTRVPVLCTCNDRWHPKLRSLLNHVEDIRFIRPPCNLVANYLCDRVLAREGVTVSKPLLQDIIRRAGSDIRNMLNSLQLWCLHNSTLEQRALARCAVQSGKDGDVGLFDAAEYMLMQGTSHGERHSINDMQACYYSADLVDLFVQENYLHFNPAAAAASSSSSHRDGSSRTTTTTVSTAASSAVGDEDRFYLRTARQRDWLSSVCAAATCISRSDAVKRMMYSEQNWTASRAHVLLAAIAPCIYTRGRYESFATGQQVFFDRQRPVKFPAWLGHNSTANKNARLLRVLTVQAAAHPQHGVTGTQDDVVCDYVPLGWELPLTQPLAQRQKDGIDDVLRVMDTYGLMRDDWDLVQQLAHYHRMQRPHSGSNASLSFGATVAATAAAIPTAVKAAFTRAFRQQHGLDTLAKAVLKHTGNTQGVGKDDDDDDDDANNKDKDDSDEEASDNDMAVARRRQAAAAAAAAAVLAKGNKRKATTTMAAAKKKAATTTTTATKPRATRKKAKEDTADGEQHEQSARRSRRTTTAAAAAAKADGNNSNDDGDDAVKATTTTRRRAAPTTRGRGRGGRATGTVAAGRGGRGSATRKRTRNASGSDEDEASSVMSSSDSSNNGSDDDTASSSSDSVSVHSVSDGSDSDV